jgi:hypothetical protein
LGGLKKLIATSISQYNKNGVKKWKLKFLE